MKKRGKGLYTNLHDHQAMMDFLQKLYGVKDDNNSKDEDSSTSRMAGTPSPSTLAEHARKD